VILIRLNVALFLALCGLPRYVACVGGFWRNLRGVYALSYTRGNPVISYVKGVPTREREENLTKSYFENC